jgi:hypothetical protein
MVQTHLRIYHQNLREFVVKRDVGQGVKGKARKLVKTELWGDKLFFIIIIIMFMKV